MASSADRPMEAAREGSGASVSQPNALGEVGEPLSDHYIPHTSGSEVGNQQGARDGSRPNMSRGIHAINLPFHQMAEFFHHMAEAIHDPNVLNFEKMRKMGGVEFEGTVDPTDAEQWLERMERVFEQLECSDAAKFKYAISLLQKDAYDWWVSVPNAKVKPPVLTWDDFLREFRMKYVPPAYCDAKRKEFLNLRQRGMSIAEYQQKFLRLSRYAGGIIKEEKDKCRKFEDGLNDSIRKNVAILQHENFCKLVSAAFTWERLDKEEASRNEIKFRKPRPDFGGPSKRGRFDYSKASSVNRPPQQKQSRSEFSTASTPNYSQGRSRVPTCPQCGKNYYGTCRRASGACFNCGSFDHKMKDCTKPNDALPLRTEGTVHKPSINPPRTNEGSRPKYTQATGASGANKASGSRATARTYAMRQREDQDGQDVVVGADREE